MPAHDGLPVLLLNSLGSDGDAWQFVHIDGARTTTYPGHGPRPRTPGWTHEAFIDEVMSEVDGPVHVVGVALGGLIGLQALARHPDRVRSAVIACGGSVRSEASRLDALRKVAVGRGEAARAGGMAAVVDETLQRWFSAFALQEAGHPGVDYARHALSAMDPGGWSDVWQSLVDSDYISAEDAEAITAPVTLVGARGDLSSGLGGVTRLHELIPVSRLEIVDGPHLLHLERPDEFTDVLERHWQWLLSPARIEEPSER